MEKVSINLMGDVIEIEKGKTIEEIIRINSNYKSKVVAAKVNNELRELTYPIDESCEIMIVDISTDDGMRIYQRSLKCLMIKAIKDVLGDKKDVVICHSVSRGIFFEASDGIDFETEDVVKIESRMKQLVEEEVPFVKNIISIEEAKEKFLQLGREDRYLAIKHRAKSYVTSYSFDGIEDYYYGYMVPNSSYLDLFKIECMFGGIILVLPRKEEPTKIPDINVPKKLFSIFTEYRNWIKILGVHDVGSLNEIIDAGKIDDLIRISEALHEKKIAQIADKICNSGCKKKIVLIAGPSSSGKTTFAHRLGIQLRVNGIIPVTISLDDYFLNREQCPLDENGEYDYEALETVDVELFNQHLNALIKGEAIEKPTFNFVEGRREYNNTRISLDDNHILVVEGIHGLNPKLTSKVDEDSKFKIYVSAITSMRIDDHNRIPTTDSRLIRRIVRDYQFRGCSALETIKRWPSVRRGEEKNIFPYQEEANIMFNSTLLYELGVLKNLVVPLLSDIDNTKEEYCEARRLIEFLSYFLTIETDEIPRNSIIKEFLGGSCFYK